MLIFKLTLTSAQRKALEKRLNVAQERGYLQEVKRMLAVLAFADGFTIETIAQTLHVSTEAVRTWVKRYLEKGVRGLRSKKSPGRPPKLTKSQKKELARLIDKGPEAAGVPGACWCSPMIQQLIFDRFGVFYSVHYISQLLRNMDFSYQKARFASDHLNKKQRRKWLKETWPEILKLAQEKNAMILFGDEASFPQWGTLSYTWTRRGHQPTVKTSGKRQGYKVFGLIDYFTGRFFAHCIEGRLNSLSYQTFLKQVLAKTRKHIILIQDGAPYHTSKSTEAFFAHHAHRLTVFQLPSYSPDYNPIEKLWKKIKEKETHLHYFPSFDALTNKVQQAVLRFQNAPREVLTLFGFYQRMAA